MPKNESTTATATAPVSRRGSADLFMIGGGQKEIEAGDLVNRTFSVKVNVECKTDDREVTACVPLYEVPLLQKRYSKVGGEARVTAEWLPAKAKHPRVIPLSLDNLRDEITRLRTEYRSAKADGKNSYLFDEIYGQEGNPIRGFYAVINKQVKAWRELEKRVIGGERMMAEDLQAIVNIATPKVDFEAPDQIDNLVEAAVGDDSAPVIDGPPEEDQVIDPLADLQDMLTEKGVDTDVVMEVCKLVGDNQKLTMGTLDTIPSLHGKKSEIREVLAHCKAWVTKLSEQQKK
jgi:hypothetical protein